MAMKPLAIFDLPLFKAWLKVPDGDTSQDTVLERIGNAASEYCEERSGWLFKKRTHTLTRDGDDRPVLLRLHRPIISVTSLTIDGVALAASEYVADGTHGKITLKTRVFPRGVGNVVVVYEAGYDDADLPGQVVAAALDLAKAHYEEWMNGAISLSSISIGTANAIIKPGLNPRIEAFLDSLKDVRG